MAFWPKGSCFLLSAQDGPHPPGMCGDGKVGATEECDDGNTASGDGCSPTCTNEGLNAHMAGIFLADALARTNLLMMGNTSCMAHVWHGSTVYGNPPWGT